MSAWQETYFLDKFFFLPSFRFPGFSPLGKRCALKARETWNPKKAVRRRREEKDRAFRALRTGLLEIDSLRIILLLFKFSNESISEAGRAMKAHIFLSISSQLFFLSRFVSSPHPMLSDVWMWETKRD